jgi:hypothetical protein
MDLVTLIAACALSVEPKLMRALIWEQSGGEPWSFSAPGETRTRVYSTLQEAIREAQAMRPDGRMIRIGLTGLSVRPPSATAAMFEPCSNIATAAKEITLHAAHCTALPRLKTDPIYCAIAAYHGSWDRPDTRFADAVRATVENSNAPNLDMPKDAHPDPDEIAPDTLTAAPHAAFSAPAATSDDRERGWSSALFPATPTKPGRTSADVQNHDRSAEESLSPGPPSATPTSTKSPAMLCLSRDRPIGGRNGWFARVSHVARRRAFEVEAWGGEAARPWRAG